MKNVRKLIDTTIHVRLDRNAFARFVRIGRGMTLSEVKIEGYEIVLVYKGARCIREKTRW